MKPLRRIAVLLLLAPVLCAQEPARLAFTPEEVKDRTLWYGLYVQGQKAGWAKDWAMRQKDGDFARGFEVQLRMKAMGQEMEFQIRERRVYDAKPPHRLRRVSSIQVQGPNKLKVALARAGTGYRAVIDSAGQQRTVDKELDYTLADDLSTELWLRRGPLPGDSITVRSLDTKELQVNTDTYTIRNIRTSIVRGVRQQFFEGKASSSKQGDMGVFRASGGHMISMVMGGFIEARLEPEKLAKRVEATQDLFVLGAVKLDKPLGAHPTKVTELVMEVSGEGAGRMLEGARQSIERGSTEGTRIIRVGEGHGEPRTATKEEITEALKATTEYPVKEARVVALAQKAVGDATTGAEKVRRLLSFVSDYVKDLYGEEHPTALDVIERKRGDCSAHATLFVALARAAGIPTREISGFMYMGDGVQAFGGHAWNEVVLDGKWAEVDPTWNQTEVDATHISLGHGDKASMAHIWTFGRLQFLLVSVKHR